MKVQNMTSNNGNKVANQFVISGIDSDDCDFETFQSYDSVIATVRTIGGEYEVKLDSTYWNWSRTTAKYRNEFISRYFPNESTKETQAKIDSGEYILTDLN